MPTNLDRIRAIKDSHLADLLSQPGVTGVDIGFKYVAGRRTDEVAIRVHVKDKHDAPADRRIPSMLQGIKTDVIQAELETVDDEGIYPVLQGGISVGRFGSLLSGTLGAVMINNANGTRMLLTNYHVLCHSDGTWKENDLVMQPGGVSVATIGPLKRAIFEGGATQAQAGVLDAAVASIEGGHGALPPRPNLNWIVDIGPVMGASDPDLRMHVRKRGRATELTSGMIDGLDGTKQLDGTKSGLGKFWLKQLVTIAPSPGTVKFVDEGDSGSVVVNDSNEIVALISGAEHSPGGAPEYKGIATPIAPVLSRMGVSIAITGLFADTAGWNQPQYYSTIQTAVYIGQLWLFARGAGSDGLIVYNWDDRARRFFPRAATGEFNDANGWNQPQYYETIQTIVYGPRLVLLARGAGDAGLQVYAWNDTPQKFDLVTSTGLFTDAGGWNQPQYYSTIQTVVAGGRLLLLARGAGDAGLGVYQWDDTQSQFQLLKWTGLFTDANGWSQPQYYSTIQTVVDPSNNALLLLARGAGDAGLGVYQWDDAQSQFQLLKWTGLFTDAGGWNQPQYYSTIQTVVYGGQLFLLARGAGEAGLQLYQWDSAQRQFRLKVSTGLFIDANGWNQPQYYATIQTSVFKSSLFLLARSAGQLGLLMYRCDDSGQTFVPLAAGNAPVVAGLFRDGDGWAQPQYYATIQTAVLSNGQLLLTARGAGNAGLLVYRSSLGNEFDYVTSTGLFPDAGGWNQPQYYSTIQTVVYNGRLLLLARGAGDAGLGVYQWDDAQSQFQLLKWTGLFPDAGGWNQPQYYSTIQTVVDPSNNALLLLARGAGDAGLGVYQWDDVQSQFQLVGWTGLFADAAGWDQPQYYSTIQTAKTSSVLLLAREPGDGGMLVYRWNSPGRFHLICAYNTPDPQSFYYGYSPLTMGLFCRAFQLDWQR